MTGKREAKREDLKARLIAATRAHIEKSGLPGLRARDITRDAGCALGGLYNAFDDLDHLILTVNLETLTLLEAALGEAVADIKSPRAALKALARTYAGFAEEHRQRWDALFDHRKADGGPAPDWMREKNSALLQHITGPLADLGTPEADLNRRARTLFAAVHGIVAFSLQERFVGLSREELLDELDRFVDGIAGQTPQ